VPTPTAPPTTTRERTPLPVVVHVLALGTFLMLTTEFVVAGLLTQISTDLGIGTARAGLLITVFAAGMVVGAPTMAALTLRLPRRTTLVAALLVFAGGHVVVALSDTFAVLLGARFLTALATGAFWAVAAVVATDAAGPEAGSRALGVVSAGGMMATVLGVPLGAVTGGLIGWQGTFWGLGALALLVALVVLRTVPHVPVGPHTPGRLRTELAALRSVPLWLTLATCACTTGGVMAAYSYVEPLLVGRTGISPGLVPLVLAGYGVGALVGSIVGGRMGDTRASAVVVAVPAVTTVVMAALLLVSREPWPTAAVLALLGLFGLSANPVLISLAVRAAGRAPTLGSGLAVAAFNTGTAGGSWVAGHTLGTSLGAAGPVALGSVVVSLTLVPALLLVRRRRREPAPQPIAAAALRPAVRPENRQPPRNVPSSAL